MTENEKQVEKKTSEFNTKTPYNRPQLVVYGDIRKITLTAAGPPTAMDNPGGDASKTLA